MSGPIVCMNVQIQQSKQDCVASQCGGGIGILLLRDVVAE